jgi:hypothetical protein
MITYGARAGANAEGATRCRCRGSIVVGIVTVERHVAEEVVDVGEKVLVRKDVLLVGVRDEDQ